MYSPTTTGFRVYVSKSGGVTPAQANQWNWHVNWAATPLAQTGPEQCSGTTAPGAGWIQYSTDAVYTDVDTSACQRKVEPIYFAGLGGSSSHYTAVGATSIYQPSATGFRIYLSQAGITPALASSRGYFVGWAAYP